MFFVEYWAGILFFISCIFIIVYEYFLKSMNPWWTNADINGYMTSMLAYGYIASYVVYFLTVYRPLIKERRKNQNYIHKQMNFLIRDMNSIFEYKKIQDMKSKDQVEVLDGLKEIYDFNKEMEILIKLDQNKISEFCNSIYPLKEAPTMKIFINEDNEFSTKQENWAALLKRKAEDTTKNIKNLYQFAHLLKLEEIDLLNSIEYSTYIQTVLNSNKGISALRSKRENWYTLTHPMYEYYELLSRVENLYSIK